MTTKPGPRTRWTVTPTYFIAIVISGVFVVLLNSVPDVNESWGLAITAFVVAILVSVPIHELGHVVIARRLGHHVDEVQIGLYAGVAWSARAGDVSVRDVLLITSAGPASNALCCGGAFVAVVMTSISSPVLLGIAAAMAVAAVLDLVPSTSRHRGVDGAGELWMSDGAVILHAWRQRADGAA